MNLGDLDDLPVTVSVERAPALLGIARGLAYQLVRRGDFPVATLKLGRRLVVPTAALMRLLGLDPPAPSVVPSRSKADDRERARTLTEPIDELPAPTRLTVSGSTGPPSSRQNTSPGRRSPGRPRLRRRKPLSQVVSDREPGWLDRRAGRVLGQESGQGLLGHGSRPLPTGYHRYRLRPSGP